MAIVRRRKVQEVIMCVICSTNYAYPGIPNKCCKECSICVSCKRYYWVDQASRLCQHCRCSACSAPRVAGENLMQDYAIFDAISGGRPLLCQKCFDKKYPDPNCQFCHVNFRTLAAATKNERKPKLPNACGKCIQEKNKALICYFCGTQPATYSHKLNLEGLQGGVCAACEGTYSCFTGKCTPSTPCKECKKEILAENEVSKSDQMYFQNPIVLDRYASVGMQKFFLKSHRLISPEIEVGAMKAEEVQHKRMEQCFCSGCVNYRTQFIKNFVMATGGSFVHDDSIPHGFEINVHPAAGDKFIRLVKETSQVLFDNGAMITEKCGTHIHVGATDYTALDTKKLLMLYVLLEPAILWTQPSSRVLKEKSHCFPCAKKYKDLLDPSIIKPEFDIRRILTAMMYQGEYGRPPRYMRGNNRSIKARYDFMNLHSLNHRGTIEIRGHAGTLDADKIIAWGAIWATLLDHAVKMSEKEIRGFIGEDPKTLLINLTPSDTHPYLIARWGAFEKTYEGKQY